MLQIFSNDFTWLASPKFVAISFASSIILLCKCLLAFLFVFVMFSLRSFL